MLLNPRELFKMQAINSPSVKGIQASLQYLSLEAQEAGLFDVASKIREASFHDSTNGG